MNTTEALLALRGDSVIEQVPVEPVVQVPAARVLHAPPTTAPV